MAEYKKYFVVDNFTDANKGFKDLTRQGWYFLDFFPLGGDSKIKIGSGSSSSNDSQASTNFIADGNDFSTNDDQHFTLYTRNISGLPKFQINLVQDPTFGGWVNNMPGKVVQPDGELNIEFIVKSNGYPLNNIFSFFNQLYNNHLYVTKDNIATKANNPYGESDEVDIPTDDKALLWHGYNIDLDSGFDVGRYNNYINGLVEQFKNSQKNASRKFFFNTSVTALDYSSREPHFQYIMHNCFIKSVELYNTFDPKADTIVNGKMIVKYDFGRLLNIADIKQSTNVNNDFTIK